MFLETVEVLKNKDYEFPRTHWHNEGGYLIMDLFIRLMMEYKDYDTKIVSNDGFDSFEIINPFWQENIRVFLDDDNDIVFSFAFQHACFEKNVDDLIGYINDYLHGKQASMEFFEGDDDLFGGGRYQTDIDTSSGESLLRSFAGDNILLYEDLYKRLRGCDCCCSIRGWNAMHNLDIDFVL